jgi:hypothetical protein
MLCQGKRHHPHVRDFLGDNISRPVYVYIGIAETRGNLVPGQKIVDGV